MPPTSNTRKAPGATMTVTQVNDLVAAPRRTSSGRTVRANTTRPSNYYAHPFGTFPAAAPLENVADDAPIGFFPAIQCFSDAITALPTEVMRQYTLVKEVEAKIHGPNQQIGEVVDTLLRYPVPSRKSSHTAINGAQGVLSFTRANSAIGSTNASLINGAAPRTALHSAQHSIAGSLVGDENAALQEPEEDLTKRKAFLDLRMHLHNSLANLDEKNGLLAEANRVLALQMSRLDSVMPHVESEISEEARLGSMTHWAYSDNRQKRHAGDTSANRRNVAATNNLAAAASIIHESDIQQARRDATREAYKTKGRGREIDSDFDDKPRKTTKTAKGKAVAALGPSAPGLVNGKPAIKRRKAEKGLAAPPMERSLSGPVKGSRAPKDVPRSTPAVEPGRRPGRKPGPLARKKGPGSAQASPALASSPLHSSFNPANVEPPPGQARPPSSRARQNSATTNLRHERLPNQDVDRASALDRSNGEKTNGKRRLIDEARLRTAEPETIARTTEGTDGPQTEDALMPDNTQMPVSRPGSVAGKADRDSKAGTPRIDNLADAPAMLRTRSTRSFRNNDRDDSSAEPQARPVGRHRRDLSNSHLVKQLAPFNRSPDLDRHTKDGDDDLESRDGERTGDGARSPPRQRPSSHPAAGPALQDSALSPPPDSIMMHGNPGPDADTTYGDAAADDTRHEMPASPLPAANEFEAPPAETEMAQDMEAADEMEELEPDDEVDGEEEEEEGSEPGDPDDPNEPKYCYCNRGSYGEMIACDNDECPAEWFHLGCTELSEAPDVEDQWYCANCRPLFVRPRRVGRTGRSGR